MARDTDETNRIGVNAVGLKFEKLRWAFREQPTSDYGIDAQIEKRDAGGAGTGKLIALQIKTGASYFRKRGEDYVYYGEARHLAYWTNHSLPVLLILHDPNTDLTLWQTVARHLIEETEDGNWSLTIPTSQTLDEKNAQLIARGVASDLGSVRRARLTLDLEHIRALAAETEIFMRVHDYVNKGLNMRGAWFIFSDDPDDDIDLELSFAMPSYTLDYYMAVAFPWLNWVEHEYLDESHGMNEIAQYTLRVEVNAVGHAALELERYYASPLPPFRPEPSDLPFIGRDDRDEEPVDWDDEES